MNELQKMRPIRVVHGNIVIADDPHGLRSLPRDMSGTDPFEVILSYAKVKGLRLIDMFQSFDKNNDHKISIEEFQRGIWVG